MSDNRDVAKPRAIPIKLAFIKDVSVALHIVYGLYALSTMTGVPALIGVALAHLIRPRIALTWLEGHAVWQLRTFWIMFAVTALSIVLKLTFILAPFGFALLGLTWLWFIYRTIKGWLRLYNQQEIESPEGWI